ncbi:hypothetical protein [Levilactobacillus brevis]|nr:hypothetical protein [Levilactobacillus brevis]
MKIQMTGYCPYCKEKGHKQIAYGLLNNDNYSILECPKGHSFIIYLQNNKYEWLIRNSLNAFIDRYYLESFMALYQAIEQFRVSFIQGSYISHGQTRLRTIDKMFSTMLDSTQILGAYKSAYLLETGELVDLKGSKHTLFTNKLSIIKLRNKIVHQGYYPSKKEVVASGNIIINYIGSVEQSIKVNVNPNPHNPRLVKLSSPVDINLINQLPKIMQPLNTEKIKRHNPKKLDVFPFEDTTLHLSGLISNGSKIPSFEHLVNIRRKNKIAEFEVDDDSSASDDD